MTTRKVSPIPGLSLPLCIGSSPAPCPSLRGPGGVGERAMPGLWAQAVHSSPRVLFLCSVLMTRCFCRQEPSNCPSLLTLWRSRARVFLASLTAFGGAGLAFFSSSYKPYYVALYSLQSNFGHWMGLISSPQRPFEVG